MSYLVKNGVGGTDVGVFVGFLIACGKRNGMANVKDLTVVGYVGIVTCK